MQHINSAWLFSPSDLTTFMESPYASAMERLRHVDPSVAGLMDPVDQLMARLQKKGVEHEKEIDRSLQEQGLDIVRIDGSTEEAAEKTLAAMQEGREVILQGYLTRDNFGGYADYLVKVPGHSSLGDWHYEVWDSKLSHTVKPYFIVQICCYVDMLESVQGVKPKELAVKLGNGETERLPVANYYAYYKTLKKRFLSFHENFDGTHPDPAVSKAYGRWSQWAEKQLLEKDHLSQVARLTRTQIKNLEKAGIHTMTDLSETTVDRVPGMGEAVFKKAIKQASLQIASKGSEKPVYELLPHEEGSVRGLALLPPASRNDVYFDIEGYPSIDGGLEYLWGNTYVDESGERCFKDFWAHDHAEEKVAFEAFIDWIFERWLEDPHMHVYHYANYEIAAIRKLMGRYGTREEQVDNLLRNNVFVDLYKVVSGGLMVGTPNYSIKSVELLYRGKRDTEVGNGADSIIVYEDWRENPDGTTWQTSKVLNDIRDYNIDDCDSTLELTEWLRKQQEGHGIQYLVPAGEGEKEIAEEVTEITKLRDTLLAEAQALKERDAQKASLLEVLAWSLEFHRRENKPTWWRLFDRMGLSQHELYEDVDCLAGLTRTNTPATKTSTRKNAASLLEYQFDPDQEFKGTAKQFYVLGEDNLRVAVAEYLPGDGLIVLRSTKELPDFMDLVPDEYVRPAPIPGAIQDVVMRLYDGDFPRCAITDFLTRSRPRITGNQEGPIVQNEDDLLAEVIDAAANLEGSTLCIQGPPGAGKTYTAKHIIGELLKRGKRVGISSNSHKAILNLLEGAARYCEESGIAGQFVKVGGDKDEAVYDLPNVSWVQKVTDNYLGDCTGGTAWAFCNDDVVGQYDYLFIDEAGQVSVANLIGMSRSTKNIILMGDQMQLGQPIQGSHPGESGMSILEYLLEGHATIPEDLGVFLPKTYRMHPEVTKLVSAQVYEDRLSSAESAARHTVSVEGPTIRSRAGICYLPVEHEGNTQGSDEEAAAVQELVGELIGAEYWPEEVGGAPRIIGWEDILIVAPYNLQVNKLKAALGPQARVGSVDKFQGQEAPIVIMSMCASDAVDSPRGVEFLFSKNRLNVALSRAQALAIVVGHPELAHTPVTKPEQMELINFYCEVVEGQCVGDRE